MDLGASAEQVIEIASRTSRAMAGMGELVAWCATAQPHDDWARLANLDWASGVEELEHWFGRLVREEKPEATITGFYFGLFNPIRDNKPVADLYLAGAPFDASDPEWMCAIANHWWPEGRYSQSSVLARVYEIAYSGEAGELGNDMEYPIVLGFATLAVCEILDRFPAASLIAAGGTLEVVLGFDDGDMVHLGRITPGGFARVLAFC